MKKKLSFILTFLLLFGLFTNISRAASNEDLIKNTVNQYFQSYYKVLQTSNLNKVDKLSNYFVDTNNPYYKYESSRLQFLIKANILNKYTLQSYKIQADFKNISINNSTAEVNIIINASLKYNYSNSGESINNLHKVTLNNVNGKWLIVADEYKDELKDLYGNFADFSDLISNMKPNDKDHVSTKNLKNGSVLPTPYFAAGDLSINSSTPPIDYIVPGDYSVYYDSAKRADAVSYARSWTSNTGGTESTSYNNLNFKSYSPNDCQNYVSQCIWWGFGGRSSANKDLPMDWYWWGNTSGTNNSTNDWINVDNFKDYLTGNQSSNNYGVQGYTTTSESEIQAGDYVYVPGHVMLISETNGTFAGTKICGHTNNRKDVTLAWLYGSKPSNMVYVHITKYKSNDGSGGY